MVARPAVSRLHLITNRHLCGDRSPAAVVGDAGRGGLGAVQLREKDLPLAELLALAREVRWALGDTPLIVNAGGFASEARWSDFLVEPDAP